MAWLIALVLFVFYLLGLFVFHAPPMIHVLPVLALVVLVVDYLIARQSKK